MIITNKTIVVTPFRDATALGPLEAVATGIDDIYRKKRYDLGPSYTHKKGNNINTVNLLFKHKWSYKSPR